MRKPIIAYLSLLLTACTAMAQRNLITVGPNVRVSAANGELSHTEVSIAANPRDAKHLVACSIVRFQGPYKRSTILYASFDGGSTWTPTLDMKAFFDSGDPYCTIGPSGITYFLAAVRNSPYPLFTYVYRSEDAGRTWLPPTRVPTFLDRASLVVDPLNANRLFVNGVTGIRDIGGGDSRTGFGLSRSLDGGLSFENLLIRASIENERHFIGGMGNCVVMSDATVTCALSQSDDDAPLEYQVQSLKLRQEVKVIKALSGEALTNAITVAPSHAMRRPPGTTNFNPSLASDRDRSC